MKSLFFALLCAAIICSTTQAADDYIIVSISEMEENTVIFSYLNYGVDRLLEKGQEENRIPANPFDIIQIISAAQKTLGNIIDYKFEVIIDNHRDTKIQASFVVTVAFGVASDFSSWTYNIVGENEPNNQPEQTGGTNGTEVTQGTGGIETTGGNNGTVVIGGTEGTGGNESTGGATGTIITVGNGESNPSESDTAFIQSLIDFGTNEVLQKGNEKNKIPEDKYYVTKINSMDTESKKNDVRYKFNLEMENLYGNIQIKMTFTVRYHKRSGKMTLTSYDYNIHKEQTGGTSGTETTGGTEGTGGATGTVITVGNEGSNPNESDDAFIQSIIDFGTNEVLQKGYQKNKIPEDKYHVTKINSMDTESKKNDTRYKFDLEMENLDGNIEIKMTFTVKYEKKSGKMTLNSYNYNIHIERN